jgi:hypothetical protein
MAMHVTQSVTHLARHNGVHVATIQHSDLTTARLRTRKDKDKESAHVDSRYAHPVHPVTRTHPNAGVLVKRVPALHKSIGVWLGPTVQQGKVMGIQLLGKGHKEPEVGVKLATVVFLHRKHKLNGWVRVSQKLLLVELEEVLEQVPGMQPSHTHTHTHTRERQRERGRGTHMLISRPVSSAASTTLFS